MKYLKYKITSFIKQYLVNLIIINFFSLIFLYDTTTFDQGLISYQSFFYSINKILVILFVFIETIFSLVDVYGVTFEIFNLATIRAEETNIRFLLDIVYKNFKYFLFFLTILFFIRYKNKLSLIKFSNKNLYIFIVFFIITLAIFFKNFDKFNQYFNSLENRIENNLIFRNDNWYLILQLGLQYENKDKVSNDFKLEYLLKNKKNVYIIINESYPNFKNEILYTNLLNRIIYKTDVKFSNYKREYSKNYTTLGSEEFVLCNKFNKEFLKIDLTKYILKNNCWSKKIKQHKIYIHSYKKNFFNRYEKYKSFFDEIFFYRDLKSKKIKDCPWNDVGSCDYDVLDNLHNLIQLDKKNKFVLFLTLNNHVGLIHKTYDNEFIDCKSNNTLNINSDFCTLYNNQIKFNNSVNEFIKKMRKNDILIMLGDTPPMFSKKLRKYFRQNTDIYVFEK